MKITAKQAFDKSRWRLVWAIGKYLILGGLLAWAVYNHRHQTPAVGPSENGSETVTIDNAKPRRDTNGDIIDAHDGCLQFFNGNFYLYGTAYGKTDGVANNRFNVYTSPDLGTWTPAGELLKDRPAGVYYRPYVVFNPRTHKYVLWYDWYPKLWAGQTGVAVSDTPTGPFQIVNSNVALSRLHPGDGSLFVDADGTAYFIYTAIDEGYAIRVERLTPDYLASTKEVSDPIVLGCEAPVLFRRGNLYYALCGPRCSFCPQGSDVVVNISPSPLGPYGDAGDINRLPNVKGAQTVIGKAQIPTPQGTYVYQNTNPFETFLNNAPFIPAQETWVATMPPADNPLFIWMADRWRSTPDGTKGHDFQFWSAPLKFNPDGTMKPIVYDSQWTITWHWSS